MVHDVLGRTVRTLAQGPQPAGVHTVVWDGRDDDGRHVASGIYLGRLTAGAFAQSQRLVLVR